MLKHAKELKDFPRDLVFPEHSQLCKGCAEGKMHSKSFPESNSQASKLFAIVHSDLKEFRHTPGLNISSFIDNHSYHAWIALLCKKGKTFTVFKHFVAMVKTQFKVNIQMLMSNFG